MFFLFTSSVRLASHLWILHTGCEKCCTLTPCGLSVAVWVRYFVIFSLGYCFVEVFRLLPGTTKVWNADLVQYRYVFRVTFGMGTVQSLVWARRVGSKYSMISTCLGTLITFSLVVRIVIFPWPGWDETDSCCECVTGKNKHGHYRLLDKPALERTTWYY